MLNVDAFFYASLLGSDDITEVTEGRIFNPARPEIDEDEDKIPYIIIRYEGGQSESAYKDKVLANLDSATISILVVANSREDLAELTELVSDTIEGDFESEDIYDVHDEWNFYIDSCQMSAGPVEYDSMKPCCFQQLTYQCDTSKR